MTKMKENVEQIKTIVGLIDDNKDVLKDLLLIATPVAAELTKTIIGSIGPEIFKVVAKIELSSVDLKKKIFDRYIKKDFSREEAIAFMLNDSTKPSKVKSLVDTAGSAIKK